MPRRVLVWAGCTALGVLALLPAALAQTAGDVVRVDLSGTVDPLSARYVRRVIGAASGAAAVVVQIDTPGGLDSAMREMIKAIQASSVPVICWTGPAGARAASAGAFIMAGCPVAAMAPGTNLGAAHPVGLSGEVLADKVTNDAAAYMRGLAEARGRNADVAERMVRDSVSISADDALRRGLIDVIEPDVESLLRAVDGRVTTVAGEQTVTIRTAGASVRDISMTFIEMLLHTAIDPNLAFLLFSLGVVGIVFEISSPGLGIAGVFGVFALVGALVILGMLPVNLAGLVLILVGIGFFVIEAYTPGVGLPAAAGAAGVIGGGLFLFDSSIPGAQVSRALVVATGLSLGVFFAYTVRAVLETRRQKPGSTTIEELVGEIGVVEQVLDPLGIVVLRKEMWTARTEWPPLERGARVRVTSVTGLTLEVEALAPETSETNAGRSDG